MKKAQGTVFLFILFLAFALTTPDESENSGRGTSASVSTVESHAKESTLSKYLPNLAIFNSSKRGSKYGVKEKKVLLKNIPSGSGHAQLGISKEQDMPKMGPGAFVYLKNKSTFAILDNENNRINFYPVDSSQAPSSIEYPKNRQALGLTLDSRNQVTLLSRQFNPDTGAAYPYYEVWKLTGTKTDAPWEQKTNFSFSDRATHGAAQSLEMQALGNALIFKGLGENEFHILNEGERLTQKVVGFPSRNGHYIRTAAFENPNASSSIQIQEYNREGVVRSHNTGEDIARLNSYRVLKSGLVALDLEADDEKQYPREIVLIDPQSGEIKARSAIKRKEDIHVDQDLHFQDSKVFQLSDSPNSSPNGRTSFEILQSDFGEN